MKIYLFRKKDIDFYYKEYFILNEESYMLYKIMYSDRIELVKFEEKEKFESIKEKIYFLLNEEFKNSICGNIDKYYQEKYLKINLKTIAETFLKSELIDKNLKDEMTLEWLL